MQKSKVGSKGEIFPPKKVREKLGLRPGTDIDMKIEDDKLVVRPIAKVRDLLKEPAQVEIALEEFHKFRRELGRISLKFVLDTTYFLPLVGISISKFLLRRHITIDAISMI